MTNSIAYNDASSTITLGGTAQTALGAAGNQQRRTVIFENISDTTMYISFPGTATADSMPVLAGAARSWQTPDCPYQALSVLCATTGKKFLLWHA